MMGIINGQGDQIIKQIKLRYRYLKKYDETDDLYLIKQLEVEDLTTIKKAEPVYQDMLEQRNYHPRINWKRMLAGLSIGLLYGLPLFLLSLIGNFSPHFDLVVLAYTIPYLSISIEFGLIIGLICGFGVMILTYIEQSTKRRFGRIGLLLAVAGILIVAFSPH